ncbi:efflux RND transporter periplasmic adaptor subunit [Phyllobacterium sp. P30BS-XVII]|uniref:efflux RND transporter periplasmic adaptor subunit n=1 Tax=Phyllobacterium sp. P30BS-XVII TaxID=2587046 RepID=UPI0015FB85E8|nr:efflux RND transporter periplasmic adaptor subunit [Phyllobacterium sp. P30BS-XVII]MBA8899203.1 multidrug efflux system membrane fusion protein [Phyllobacterium sp. P30BS-XVII]
MVSKTRALVVILIIAALGAGAYVTRERWWKTPGATTQDAASPAAGQREGGRRGGGRRGGGSSLGPTPVLVAEAKSADVPVYIDGVGSVRPLNSVVVRSQVSGKLAAIEFQEGQDVKAGDVLARIDDAIYRAQLDQATAKKAQDQALLANTKLDLERYIRLAQTNAGTQQQADTQRALVAQYEAQLKSDEAAIESAQATLDYTIIRAPIDGRTGIRNVDVGNIVSTSDTTGIVTLSQIKPISVQFSIPQQRLAKINVASAANTLPVQALSGDGKTVIDSGTLAVIDNQVDPTTGTVKLKANFPNDKLVLWPGAFVNARLLVQTLNGAIVVPTAAVQRGPTGTFVYLLQEGDTVAMHPVTVGQQDDVQAVINEGVAAGDKIVTTGFARLQDGAKVQVTSAADAGTTPALDAKPADDGKQPDGTAKSGERQHKRRNQQGGGASGGEADSGTPK